MPPKEILNRPHAPLPVVSPPTISANRSIVDAMDLMLRHELGFLLTTIDGKPTVLSQADVDRVLPSPATSLARYEVPARLERISVRHALRGPSPTVPIEAPVERATAIMRANGWAPIIVMDGDRVHGVLSAPVLLERLLEQLPRPGRCEAVAS